MVFSLEGVTGSQRECIEWTLTTCAADRGQVDDILDPAAVDLLAARLRRPLQIEQHLTLALQTGYRASEKPIGEAIMDCVLSKQIDDLEPSPTAIRLRRSGSRTQPEGLTRHGYPAKLLDTRTGEVRTLSRQTLGVERSREKEQMLAAGLPI